MCHMLYMYIPIHIWISPQDIQLLNRPCRVICTCKWQQQNRIIWPKYRIVIPDKEYRIVLSFEFVFKVRGDIVASKMNTMSTRDVPIRITYILGASLLHFEPNRYETRVAFFWRRGVFCFQWRRLRPVSSAMTAMFRKIKQEEQCCHSINHSASVAEAAYYGELYQETPLRDNNINITRKWNGVHILWDIFVYYICI